MTASRTVQRLKITDKDGDCAVVDIFEHRLDPAPGRSREEMIFNLLPMMAGLRGGRLYTHEVGQMAANGLNHPHGHYRPGAVLVIDRPPEDEPDCLDVHIDMDHITLPDGSRHALKDYCPRDFSFLTEQHSRHAMANLQSSLESDPLLGLAMGAIDALLPLPYAQTLVEAGAGSVFAIVARAARLVETGRSATGRAAATAAWSDAEDVLSKLHWMWIVEPDRGTLPTRLEKGPQFKDILALCEPGLLEAGRKLLSTAQRIPDEAITKEAFTAGDDAKLSNHERLGLKGQIRALDEAIEDCVPEEMLKPAALKRRRRRAA